MRDRAHFFLSYEANHQDRCNSVFFGTTSVSPALASQLQKYLGTQTSPFRSEIVLPTLLEMRRRYRDRLFSTYGFRDAFNPSFPGLGTLRHGRMEPQIGWVDTDYLGIDQGPFLAMIKNHRTGLVWRTLRRNLHGVLGLRRVGFTGGWAGGAVTLTDVLTTTCRLESQAGLKFPITYKNVYNRNVKPASQIRRFVLTHVADHPQDVSRLVADHFAISRQAASRHVARLVEQGLLAAEGRTRNRKYRLVVLGRVEDTTPISPALQEDVLWRDRVLPLLLNARENVRDICNYGFTEMVNNAKDHSGSATVSFSAEVTAATIKMRVWDEGVGIFRKIKEALALEDERHAILELAKGKLTTDPERHTGEGVFFTSRMFDWFAIGSGRLALVHRREQQDFLIEEREQAPGTFVSLGIATDSAHTMSEIFERHATTRDDYAFQRTHVVVALAQAEGDKLISRSQAKRIMARLERFKEVMLDFRGVSSIGPAFADEIFRVFRAEHPDVRLTSVDANEEVQKMIRRAEATGMA